MGVVYIGDRAVGKTHLAVELANPHGNYVKVANLNYEHLKANLLNADGTAKPTRDIDCRYLDVEVKLPTGTYQIPVDWIDSPGEIFRTAWQSEHLTDWQKFLDTIKKSEGILLILAPYRDILPPDINPDEHRIPTLQQWCNRFERWVEFFRHDCPQARHIAICLNKGDLLSADLPQVASKLAYEPHRSEMNWLQRHTYVANSYFRPVFSQLEQINKSRSGLSVRCFITSIYNRTLLELPWIYLASYLAN